MVLRTADVEIGVDLAREPAGFGLADAQPNTGWDSSTRDLDVRLAPTSELSESQDLEKSGAPCS